MTVKDEEIVHHLIKMIEPGTLFGEIALIHNCVRTATVQTLNYTMCSALQRTHFGDLMKKFPQIIKRMKTEYVTFEDPWKKFVIKLIRKVNYLKSLNLAVENYLLYSMKTQHYEPGQLIFKSGDTLNKIAFVVSGEVKLAMAVDKDQEILMDTLP